MKHFLFIFINVFTFCVLPAKAQLLHFSVTEFKYAPSDMTARDPLSQKTDDNGTPYAIIKVKSDHSDNLQDYRFDFGLMNSFSVHHPESQELWVYVQKNARTVTISREGYVSISKYDLGVTIRAGNTYIMILNAERKDTPTQPTVLTGTLSVNTQPTGAAIKIDGKDYGKAPNKISGLPEGKYFLTLTSDGYKQMNIEIDIIENQTTNIDVELEEGFETISGGRRYTIEGNGKTVSFDMKLVEAETQDLKEGEKTKNKVVNDFLIGETEVTQELWYAVMGQSPTSDGEQWRKKYGLGDKVPAYFICYDDCKVFLSKLNKLTGQMFRYPTESEWTFAAKGGKKSKGFMYAGSNIRDGMWYKDNSNSTAHPVKEKPANELGIYEMSGNVAELLGDMQAARGGSWRDQEYNCSIDEGMPHFVGYDRPSRKEFIGLRLAQDVVIPKSTLSVKSTPSGATILIDGKDYGQTPKDIPGLLIGNHLLELKAEGYYDELLSIKIEDNKSLKHEMVLVPHCADEKHPHKIDMGNGIVWACCNVGAQTPIDEGNLYAWGKTSPRIYNEQEYNKKAVMEFREKTDAAYVNWGANWRTPTIGELEMLMKTCTWSLATVGGKKGVIGVAGNGKVIFFPAGNYWSSSKDSSKWRNAQILSLGFRLPSIDSINKYWSESIRPVISK